MLLKLFIVNKYFLEIINQISHVSFLRNKNILWLVNFTVVFQLLKYWHLLSSITLFCVLVYKFCFV